MRMFNVLIYILCFTLFLVGIVSASNDASVQYEKLLLIAVASGAIGGLFQDIAQNKGIIKLPKRIGDEIYLGSLLGLILGAASGFLIFVTNPSGDTFSIGIAAFLAGSGLKGIGEALTSKKPEKGAGK